MLEDDKALEVVPKGIPCQPLKPVDGRVILKPRTQHPALVALAHFGNRLQAIGYPFSGQERRLFDAAIESLGRRKGVMICPNCVEQARFLPIDKGGKLKAWFCKCTYKNHHMNGCRRGD